MNIRIILSVVLVANISCKCLVYYEIHTNIEDAILREKQIKSRSRKYKLNLIKKMHPDWVDLYDSIC